MPRSSALAAQKLSCLGNQATPAAKDGEISLRIFMDRASADIYDGAGTLHMPMAQTLSPENQNLKLSCPGGDARIISLNVYQLTSAWK